MKGELQTTVIIPNYNGTEDTLACLESLKRQSMPSAIIVVDDGSDAESLKPLKEHIAALAGKLPEAFGSLTLLCHEKNRGFAAAVNTGIRAAKSPFVILLNNDARAGENFVRALYAAIGRYRDAFSVSALMLAMDGEKVDSAGDYFCALGWAFSPGRDKARARCERPLRVTSACAGAAIYNRRLLLQLGCFDEAHFCYLEDVDIGLRACRAGYGNYYEPGASVLHKGSAASGSRYNAFKTRLTAANSLYVIHKNLPLWMVVLYAPLIGAGLLIKGGFYLKKGLFVPFLQGLRDGYDKCRAHPAHARTTKKTLLADVRLFFALLGNCIRRVAP